MKEIPQASVKQLAHKIKGFAKHPRFAFFLGAGASRQSGIITASEMIRVFKERIFADSCPAEIQTDEGREQWLKDLAWYQKEGGQYCKLFEEFEPKEIGRQRYIESIVEGQEPSFGYVVLANLIASNYANTVITTNFDDLVYGACTSYTGIRPIVYAYGVLASEMRITAERPKILKLHGDYLYSSLKNTDAEIASQDPNMSRQLTQVLSEYGLVVVGYAGGDASIMKVLSGISEKNDLYWCILRGEEPLPAVRQLLREKRGYLVEIAGFDEMMSEVRQIVGFDVSKMFGSIQERQDQIIDKLKSFASAYSIDILSEIVEALQNQTKQATEEQIQIKKIQSLDFYTRGGKALVARDLATAERYFREALALTPNDVSAHINLGVAVLRSNRLKEAETLFRKAIELEPNNALAFSNLGSTLFRGAGPPDEAEAALRKAIELDPSKWTTLINFATHLRVRGREAEALTLAEKAFELEPQNAEVSLSLAGIHKALGDEGQSQRFAELVRGLTKPDDWYELACLESVSGNPDKALEHLKRASDSGMVSWEWLKYDPDLEGIRQDPRFISIDKDLEARVVPSSDEKANR